MPSNAASVLQPDPAGMLDGPNMYAYCGNDPVNRVDPSGALPFIGPFVPRPFSCIALFTYYGLKWMNDPDLSGYYQWRLHAAVGCEMARAGCDYSTTHMIFQSWEIGESAPGMLGIPDIPTIVNWPSYSANDVHASMWGWYFSTWTSHGNAMSCKDMAIRKFNRIAGEEIPRGFDIETMPPNKFYVNGTNFDWSIGGTVGSGWWLL